MSMPPNIDQPLHQPSPDYSGQPIPEFLDPTRYCENDECRTLVFLLVTADSPTPDENCPGCGQFGRKKGQQ